MKLRTHHYVILVLALMALLLAACAQGEPLVVRETVEVVKEVTVIETVEVEKIVEVEKLVEVLVDKTTPPSEYNEAPALAALVTAGQLPPVDERLPAEPLVVEPVDRVGEYGGTWHTALVGGQDTAWLRRTVSYDYLMRWRPQWDGLAPNIAKEVIPNDDGSEYTFLLREGMKWSDGEPFTAHDIVFYWEDIANNPDISPGGPPAWMIVGDGETTVEAVDDYTVVFKFAAPNGLFLQFLATPDGWLPTRYPKHYLSQFHQKYNPDGIAALISANNATDWVHLFQLKGSGVPGAPVEAIYQNSDLPTLYPWIFTTAYGEGTRVIAERNPYYWKVDTAGNQLPYIDTVTFDILEDIQVLLLKVLNGEVDMMSRHFNTNDNKAVLADNRAAGEYDFFETRGSGNTLGLHFNLTHQDPRMREIFNIKDFRIGVSQCINRQEYIDVFFIGEGEPMASAISKDVPDLYDEEMYNQYIEFDPDLAAEHFAAAGMEQGSDGNYLGPDGQPFSFIIQATDSFGHGDRAELITQHLQACGLNVQLNVMDRALLYARKDANEHDVHVWGAGAGPSVFIDPRHLFPFSQESTFAQAWVTWYRNPSGAGADTPPEEPPDIVKRQMELYEQIKATGDYQEQIELMREIIDIAKDQFYVIGLSSSVSGYGIVKNNFHNVPVSMPGSWQYPDPAPTNPEQYFITAQ